MDVAWGCSRIVSFSMPAIGNRLRIDSSNGRPALRITRPLLSVRSKSKIVPSLIFYCIRMSVFSLNKMHYQNFFRHQILNLCMHSALLFAGKSITTANYASPLSTQAIRVSICMVHFCIVAPIPHVRIVSVLSKTPSISHCLHLCLQLMRKTCTIHCMHEPPSAHVWTHQKP